MNIILILNKSLKKTLLENLETYEQTNETFVETNEEKNDKVELKTGPMSILKMVV